MQAGIFVAFEETLAAIFANVEGLRLELALPWSAEQLFFMDAQPSPAFVATGDFDLGGMLAALEARRRRWARGASCSTPSTSAGAAAHAAARRREIYRLHEWLLARADRPHHREDDGGDGKRERRHATSASCSSWWTAR